MSLVKAKAAGCSDALEPLVVSYVKLCDVIDLLSVSKGGFRVNPDTLEQSCRD